MGLEYVNRRGDKYFVLQGETKTGKPKYYCAKKPNALGKQIDELPPGFEIYEHPEKAAVVIRKLRPTRIQSFEKELLVGLAKELISAPSLVDIDGDNAAIYVSGENPSATLMALNSIFGSPGKSDEHGLADWIIQHAQYSPMLRFTLLDDDKRIYSASRWCYRGSFDDWMDLHKAGTLKSLAQTYFPHVGKESFFELF